MVEEEKKQDLQERTEKILDELWGKSGDSYTLPDVLKHPVKYSKGFFSVGKEMIRDSSSTLAESNANASSTKQMRNTACLSTSVVAANILSIGPHELLHALGGALAGNTILDIAITPPAGGNLYHAIFPWITTKTAIEGLGGSVTIIPSSEASAIIGLLSPYAILTPLAAYAILEGKKKQETCFSRCWTWNIN